MFYIQAFHMLFVSRSVCLLMQAATPCLLYGSGTSDLTLLGGTNAEMAPQIDYTDWVGFIRGFCLVKITASRFSLINFHSAVEYRHNLTQCRSTCVHSLMEHQQVLTT